MSGCFQDFKETKPIKLDPEDDSLIRDALSM